MTRSPSPGRLVLRLRCPARAILVMCLALGGPPSGLVMAADDPPEAVRVTGEYQGGAASVSAGTAFSFEYVSTSHESLDGCYILAVVGRGQGWVVGTLTVYDGDCQPWGSVEGRERTWEGEWFVPDHGPTWIWYLQQLSDPVWLRGRGRNEGSSAVVDFTVEGVETGDFETREHGLEGGAIEAWLFPTPPSWQHPIEALR